MPEPQAPVSDGPVRSRSARRTDDPVIPEVGTDDSDTGWGGSGDETGARDDEWYRRERPPHHE